MVVKLYYLVCGRVSLEERFCFVEKVTWTRLGFARVKAIMGVFKLFCVNGENQV